MSLTAALPVVVLVGDRCAPRRSWGALLVRDVVGVQQTPGRPGRR
ncbi:hypothetical protein [Micromonospora sp. CPCC 205561]